MNILMIVAIGSASIAPMIPKNFKPISIAGMMTTGLSPTARFMMSGISTLPSRTCMNAHSPATPSTCMKDSFDAINAPRINVIVGPTMGRNSARAATIPSVVAYSIPSA